MSGEVIDKSNIVSLGSTSWEDYAKTMDFIEASGTFYIYAPVARVRSYAKKGWLLATAYTYVSIYAYRNGNWVSIGSCNSVRESDDSGSTSNDWYYNYNGYSGLDSVFKVTYSINCNGAGDRGGNVSIYAGSLAMSHANAYSVTTSSGNTSPFYGKNIKGVGGGTSPSGPIPPTVQHPVPASGVFDTSFTPAKNYQQGNPISSAKIKYLCTI